MRAFLVFIFAVAIFIAIASASLGTVASIGYGLYSWAVLDMSFKAALWTGFSTWLITIATTFCSMIVAGISKIFIEAF